MIQRGQSKRRNCQRKCFHYCTYIVDHASIRFFFYVNSLQCFVRFPLYHLLHLLSSDRFAALTSSHNVLFEYMNFLEINYEEEFFVIQT